MNWSVQCLVCTDPAGLGVSLELREVHPQASGPAATYVRVLEHALSEGEAREAALRKAVAEAEAAEESTRQLLASSRGDLAAGQRALLQQVQRVQALEALRLSDMQALAELASDASCKCK
ncbi:hypothetical protein HaLaN_19134, partial [Haematococcus lacustris]